MKVADLIRELSEFDPEDRVGVPALANLFRENFHIEVAHVHEAEGRLPMLVDPSDPIAIKKVYLIR